MSNTVPHILMYRNFRRFWPFLLFAELTCPKPDGSFQVKSHCGYFIICVEGKVSEFRARTVGSNKNEWIRYHQQKPRLSKIHFLTSSRRESYQSFSRSLFKILRLSCQKVWGLFRWKIWFFIKGNLVIARTLNAVLTGFLFSLSQVSGPFSCPKGMSYDEDKETCSSERKGC